MKSIHPPIPPNCQYFTNIGRVEEFGKEDIWIFECPWYDTPISVGVTFCKNSVDPRDQAMTGLMCSAARCAWLDEAKRLQDQWSKPYHDADQAYAALDGLFSAMDDPNIGIAWVNADAWAKFGRGEPW